MAAGFVVGTAVSHRVHDDHARHITLLIAAGGGLVPILRAL
jgi:hypothetical protein